MNNTNKFNIKTMIMFIILLISIINAAEIMTLTKDYYGKYIENHEFVFVKYVTKWCKRSEQLQPHFIDVATSNLKEKVKFATIDCDDNMEICEYERIKGFPTMILFRKDRMPQRYEGDRKSESIYRFINESIRYPIENIKREDISKYKEENVIVLVDKNNKTDHYKNFLYTGDFLKPIKFLFIEDESETSIKVYNKEFEKPIEFELKDYGVKELTEFTIMNTLPLADDINYELYKRIDRLEIYTGWFAYEKKLTEEEREMINKISREYYGRIAFFVFSVYNNPQQLNDLRQSGSKLPAFSMIHKNKRTIYALKGGELTYERVKQYIEDVIDGKAKYDIKSSPEIPEKEQGEVKRINALQLDSFVQKEGVDSVIIFCTERAEICKAFIDETLPEVRNRLKEFKHLEFGILDPLTDDVPPTWHLKQLPTIYLFSDKKDEKTGLKYSYMYDAIPKEIEVTNFISKNVAHPMEFVEDKKQETKQQEQEQPKKEL